MTKPRLGALIGTFIVTGIVTSAIPDYLSLMVAFFFAYAADDSTGGILLGIGLPFPPVVAG